MVKKLLLLLMAVALLTMVGCGKQAEETQMHTEEPSVPATTETAESTSPSPEETKAEEPSETTAPAEETEPEQESVPQNTTEPEKVEETEPEPTAATEPEQTEETEPPQTEATEPETNWTEPEVPETETTAPPTEPSEIPEETGGNDSGAAVTDYETFIAMSPAEQQAYVESFDSIDQFFDWYNTAKAEYEAANPPIDVGDGVIDMEDIIGGKTDDGE